MPPGEVDNEGKPYVKLTETDGNVFFLLGRCTRALKNAGLDEKAIELREKVMAAGSYDEALQHMMAYCHVE